MTEPAKATTATAEKPIHEDKDFHDILRALIGKSVTCVNTESYEAAPVGFQIKSGYYRAKVTGLGNDYLILRTEMTKKKDEQEPVKQFIPLNQVKRVSLMKSECLLHI